MTFSDTRAFVASGEGRTVRTYDLHGNETHKTHVPLGSYNIQRTNDHIVTPSLGLGTLTLLDLHRRTTHEVRVARAAHDATVV